MKKFPGFISSFGNGDRIWSMWAMGHNLWIYRDI